MRTPNEVSCASRGGKEKRILILQGRAGESREGALKLCSFFSPPACGTRGAVRGGPGPRRRARRAVAAGDPSPATVWVPFAATTWDPSPATTWVPSPATAWGASAATAWVPSPVTACGALDMLHRNEEHSWKSLHVD
jgi:hypothetical protein